MLPMVSLRQGPMGSVFLLFGRLLGRPGFELCCGLSLVFCLCACLFTAAFTSYAIIVHANFT
ncbi:hypothetical protein EJ02DRAFT_78588 [Clathrospora elynae]|uniref:Uncharacterized protein n=1 Tax=Clathrospora elynae TaxID=706981 RepID=A0A6A5SVS8_9PLEO|nr:hypothetical protein EJ02DRAFT_78588 [Clathrospora elynae]